MAKIRRFCLNLSKNPLQEKFLYGFFRFFDSAIFEKEYLAVSKICSFYALFKRFLGSTDHLSHTAEVTMEVTK